MQGQLVGSVFENWGVIDSVPSNAKKLCNGVDFGFSISKFASVDIYQLDGCFILDELVYDNKLENPQAAQQMKDNGYTDGTIAYCDYAEPKSIAELKRAGIKAVPCESKTDIKSFAIKKLNGQIFYITKRSTNLKEELEDAVWDEKTGKIKKSNKDHLIDALLYGVGSLGKYDGRYYIA